MVGRILMDERLQTRRKQHRIDIAVQHQSDTPPFELIERSEPLPAEDHETVAFEGHAHQERIHLASGRDIRAGHHQVGFMRDRGIDAVLPGHRRDLELLPELVGEGVGDFHLPAGKSPVLVEERIRPAVRIRHHSERAVRSAFRQDLHLRIGPERPRGGEPRPQTNGGHHRQQQNADARRHLHPSTPPFLSPISTGSI